MPLRDAGANGLAVRCLRSVCAVRIGRVRRDRPDRLIEDARVTMPAMSRIFRPVSRSRAVLLLGYAALSIYFTGPLWATASQLGIEDWDVLLFYHAAVFKSIYEHASLPFWNPWYCGGNVLWQNPQVALVSPIYVLASVMSLPLAMKVNVSLHYFCGFLGMDTLVRRSAGLTWWPAVLLLASLFTRAGGPVFHLAVGHATFLPYFYLPWILLLFISAVETRALRHAAGTGAALALTIYSGGLHMAFMAASALGCFALAAAVFRREWHPLAALVAVGLFTFLLAAPKLVPAFLFL